MAGGHDTNAEISQVLNWFRVYSTMILSAKQQSLVGVGVCELNWLKFLLNET